MKRGAAHPARTILSGMQTSGMEGAPHFVTRGRAGGALAPNPTALHRGPEERNWGTARPAFLAAIQWEGIQQTATFLFCQRGSGRQTFSWCSFPSHGDVVRESFAG